MDFWFTLILVVDVIVALCIIGLVLLQHGKGADVGAAFGSGASGSLFGASGSANFLSRTTAILATASFLTSLGLSYMVGARTATTGGSVMDAVKTESVPVQPAAAVKPEVAAPAPIDAASKAKDIPK